MRAAGVLVSVMVALVAAQAAAYLPRLTGPLPAHFGPAGRPDAWTDRGGLVAITAFLVAVSVFLAFALLRLIQRMPREWLRVPRRDEWFSTAAGATRAGELLAVTFRVVAAATLALFLAIQQWVYLSALRGDPRVPPAAVLVLVAAYLAVVVIALVVMTQRFRRGPAGAGADGPRVYSAGRVEPRRD